MTVDARKYYMSYVCIPTHFASDAEKGGKMRMIYASARWLLGQLPLICSTFPQLSLIHSPSVQVGCTYFKIRTFGGFPQPDGDVSTGEKPVFNSQYLIHNQDTLRNVRLCTFILVSHKHYLMSLQMNKQKKNTKTKMKTVELTIMWSKIHVKCVTVAM